MASNLRSYFGCLTASLKYLHEQSIRHKDIKPQNILISKGRVLFADFGISRDCVDNVGSTTTGLTPASPRYCAPEVAAYEARNTSSDIWSLGCVFIEMAAALQGLSVDWIKEYFAKAGSTSPHFHTNHTLISRFMEDLEGMGASRDRRLFTWVKPMLLLDRYARSTAARKVEMITDPGACGTDSTPNMFCGICCVSGSDSDSMDSLVDELDTMTTIPQVSSTSGDDRTMRPKTNNVQGIPGPLDICSTIKNNKQRHPDITSPGATTVSRDDIEKFYIAKRLEWEGRFHNSGVSYDEIKKYRHHTRHFVKEKYQCVEKQRGTSVFNFAARLDSRPNYPIFGAPIWLTRAFTGTRRSLSEDFGGGDQWLQVPIVVAECCTFIVNQRE